MAQDHPDHPGMGDKERSAGFLLETLLEKRQCPVLEVQKAFPARGSEGVQVFSPLFEPGRVLLFDFLEGSAVPSPQVNLIECRMADDGLTSCDDPGCMPAPGEAASVDGVNGQGGQGLVPVPGLGDADVI